MPTTTVPPATTSTSRGDGAALAGGRHPAYVHRVSLRDSSVTVDVIQFFIGDDAVRAAVEDGHSADDVDDDYWVRNTNDGVRTLPVAADADVFVLTASGLQHETSPRSPRRPAKARSVPAKRQTTSSC
jgi:hypothetical protein